MQVKLVQAGSGCESGTQALPHRPQLAGSVARVLQTPLQQLWPAGHATDGLPQKFESVCVLRQLKLTQVGRSAGQAEPHAPQLLLLNA